MLVSQLLCFFCVSLTNLQISSRSITVTGKKNGTDKFGIHWHTRSKWNIKLNTDEKIYSYSYTVTTKIVYIKTFLKQHPEDVILVNHGRHLVLIIVDNTTGPGKSKGFQPESVPL